MRGQVYSIDTLLDPAFPPPERIYLDATDWRLFLHWLSDEPAKRVAPLVDGRWHVILFSSIMNRLFGSNSHRTRQLREVGIEFDALSCNLDESYVVETQLAYFNGDSTARSQSELLSLARRREGNGRVAILSQFKGFWRVPMVDAFFLDISSLRGVDDLPAQFDLMIDLGIHRSLASALSCHSSTSSRGDILNTALIALRDHIRTMSGLTTDGRSLMEQAFAQAGNRCRLNPLTDPSPQSSQQNEQRGFREIYAGAWTALRNPLIHEGTNGTFAQSRYPDQRTLYKYLCFLSILCERADAPLP